MRVKQRGKRPDLLLGSAFLPTQRAHRHQHHRVPAVLAFLECRTQHHHTFSPLLRFPSPDMGGVFHLPQHLGQSGPGPEAGTSHFWFVPFWESQVKRPGDTMWEVLLGALGWERIGRNRYLKVLFIPFELEPVFCRPDRLVRPHTQTPARPQRARPEHADVVTQRIDQPASYTPYGSSSPGGKIDKGLHGLV